MPKSARPTRQRIDLSPRRSVAWPLPTSSSKAPASITSATSTSSCPAIGSICLTGVSGSGKSSLAFDTLYAEGQRRYVESLSSFARQFLGQMPKPDVDLISGLSPSISISQKSSGQNPRSTVGTITEIYDYLRVLYARTGLGHCPQMRAADHGPDARADHRPASARCRKGRSSRCWRR